MNSVNVTVSDFKPNFDEENTICRCCFSSDRLSYNIDSFHVHFLEVAGVNVLDVDGMPRWICYECRALLLKAYRFRRQVNRAQTLWSGYLSRCAPFPIDSQDAELKSYARPHLQQTELLCLDVSQWSCDVIEHKKLILEPIATLPPFQNLTDVKEECSFSDYEDNLTLENYKINSKYAIPIEVTEFLESALDKLKDEHKGIDKTIVKRERGIKKERRDRDVKKSGDKKKRKRKLKDIDQEDKTEEAEQSKKRIRNPVEIDPEKIEVITLDAEEELRSRREKFNSRSMKFPHHCHHCFIGFNYEYKLENHMKKHSPSRGTYFCAHCSMYFPTSYSHKVHTHTHTRRYRCRVCDVIARDPLTITNHYRHQHEGITPIFTCEICGKISNNSKTHRGHVRNSHGSRPECAHCGKTFVNLSSLTEHLQIHQGIKNFECPTCGKRFRTRNQVQHHQTMHSEARDYYCVECDTRFKSAQNLKQHLEKSMKHKDKRNFKFSCVHCGRKLESSAQLTRHISIHHEGVRTHHCSHCGRALASKNALKKHEKMVHGDERPVARHVCHHCGRSFTAKTTLVNHVRTHTGEKPFECEECGRRFAQRTALYTHVKLVHKKINYKKVAIEPVPEMPSGSDMDVEVKPTRVFDAWGRSDLYFAVSAPQ